MRFQFSLLATLFISLGAYPSFAQEPKSQRDRLAVPLPGVVTEATVGSPIFTDVEVVRFPAQQLVAPDLDTEVTIKVPVTMEIAGGVLSLRAGQRLSPQEFDGHRSHVAPDAFVSKNGRVGAAYLLDWNRDLQFDSVWVNAGGMLKGWSQAYIEPSAPYESVNRVVSATPERSEEMFRKELLYLGYSKGTLRIQYREFNKRFAREPFFQDLSYDLDSFPGTISFQSVQIEVLDANNNVIRYRISRAPTAD